MKISKKHEALYAAFDLYPSAKGAATHIYNFSDTLFNFFESSLLFVLGDDKMPTFQAEEKGEIVRFNQKIPNYLDRAGVYSMDLAETIKPLTNLKIAHFRDIWSALAILKNLPNPNCKTIFEVNGLPSIELPYRYLDFSEQMQQKLYNIEQFCFEKSDALLVPSLQIKKYLMERNISESKITVISNGAEIPQETKKPENAPEKYLIYFGALQSWQGVDVLFKAFAGLKDFEGLKLVICSSHKKKYTKNYLRLARRLGIEEQITWNFQLPKEQLYAWISHALLSIAPLKETERNIKQGCSPLKILESMACQTCIIASDLPVVREIVTHKKNAHLVRPDRPADLSRGIRLLLDQEEYRQKLAKQGFETLKNNFTWKVKKENLKTFYTRILTLVKE